MLHFYYYIPPCPKCGSRKTGRYIRSGTDSRFIIGDCLKKGEIVQAVDEIGYNNCFCASCGNEWYRPVTISLITGKRLSAERKARGTQEMLADYEERFGKQTSLWL